MYFFLILAAIRLRTLHIPTKRFYLTGNCQKFPNIHQKKKTADAASLYISTRKTQLCFNRFHWEISTCKSFLRFPSLERQLPARSSLTVLFCAPYTIHAGKSDTKTLISSIKRPTTSPRIIPTFSLRFISQNPFTFSPCSQLNTRGNRSRSEIRSV